MMLNQTKAREYEISPHDIRYGAISVARCDARLHPKSVFPQRDGKRNRDQTDRSLAGVFDNAVLQHTDLWAFNFDVIARVKRWLSRPIRAEPDNVARIEG